MLRMVLFLCCVLISLLEAHADERERRRSVLIPYIQSTSDCMAREAVTLPGLADAITSNDWSRFSKELATHCAEQVRAMIQIYEKLYGTGSGPAFFQHRYMEDLPRAVRSRLPMQVVAKLKKKTEDEKSKPKEPANRETEHPGTPSKEDATGVVPKRAENGSARDNEESIEAKREAMRPQPTFKPPENPVEPSQDSKTVSLQVARLKMSASRDKLYECTDQSLPEFARMIPNNDTLVAAVMKKCGSDFEAALQTVIDIFRIDAGIDAVTDLQRSLLRDEIVKVVREHIVAEASEPKAPHHQ